MLTSMSLSLYSCIWYLNTASLTYLLKSPKVFTLGRERFVSRKWMRIQSHSKEAPFLSLSAGFLLNLVYFQKFIFFRHCNSPLGVDLILLSIQWQHRCTCTWTCLGSLPNTQSHSTALPSGLASPVALFNPCSRVTVLEIHLYKPRMVFSAKSLLPLSVPADYLLKANFGLMQLPASRERHAILTCCNKVRNGSSPHEAWPKEPYLKRKWERKLWCYTETTMIKV